MKYSRNKILISLLCIILLFGSLSTVVFAHSGRTDASGGHRDNKNVSGLGSYHYHCGGYPPHLHVLGYCPYRDTFPLKVSVDASNTSLRIGETAEVSASVSPSNSCSTSVTWESSAPDVVQVNDGQVYALNYGTAIITATTFNGKVGSVKIKVKERVADSVKIIGFDEQKMPLFVGDSLEVDAEIYPEDVDNPSIIWSSTNPEIATVEDGVIKAASGGTVMITAATANGKTNSVELVIQEVVAEKISINAADTYMVGDEASLSVNFTPKDTSSRDIEWECSDNTIAIISEEGFLRAIAPGEVIITAIQKDVQDSTCIQIKPINVEEIRLDTIEDFNGRLIIGEVVQVKATVFPENATYKDVKWFSSDPEVAEIDNDGIITAKAVGKSVIHAQTEDGTESTITVKVTSKYHDVLIGGIVITIITGGVFYILRKVKH